MAKKRWRYRYGGDEPWGYFPKSQPREAKGGIKAQSTRGSTFGTSWWARRWVQVLESFNIGARLQRGRSYARKGQVLDIDVKPGGVSAKVQGSDPRPYKVSIGVKTLTQAEWNRVAEVLSNQAIYTAKLLAGEMPEDIEKPFQEAGCSLFPEKMDDLKTSCSCPDWSNPCKHIAATYYLLGEEFDRDPFLLFRMRGMERDALLAMLHSDGDSEEAAEPETALPTEALTADMGAFWGSHPTDDRLSPPRPPQVHAAMVRQLGAPPFWRARLRLVEAVEPVYAAAAAAGLEVFAGAAAAE